MNTRGWLLHSGIFGFGLSEREHGADIYANETSLAPQADGSYLANGEKYYIGNGNEATEVELKDGSTVSGRIVEDAPKEEFFGTPRSERAQRSEAARAVRQRDARLKASGGVGSLKIFDCEALTVRARRAAFKLVRSKHAHVLDQSLR